MTATSGASRAAHSRGGSRQYSMKHEIWCLQFARQVHVPKNSSPMPHTRALRNGQLKTRNCESDMKLVHKYFRVLVLSVMSKNFILK